MYLPSSKCDLNIMNLNKDGFVESSLFHISSLVRGVAMSKSAGCCKRFLHYAFDYETPKTLVIPSLGVGFVFRFTQFLVVMYVVG